MVGSSPSPLSDHPAVEYVPDRLERVLKFFEVRNAGTPEDAQSTLDAVAAEHAADHHLAGVSGKPDDLVCDMCRIDSRGRDGDHERYVPELLMAYQHIEESGKPCGVGVSKEIHGVCVVPVRRQEGVQFLEHFLRDLDHIHPVGLRVIGGENGETPRHW